jgi:hypothetical protein
VNAQSGKPLLTAEFSKLSSRVKFFVDIQLPWSFNFECVSFRYRHLFGSEREQWQALVEKTVQSIEPQFDRLSKLLKELDFLNIYNIE